MDNQLNVIITGGSGFIGSHFTDLCLEKGCKVKVIDNFSTGRPGNLAHHKNNQQCPVK